MISVLKIRIKLEKMRENTLIRCSQAYNNFSHTFYRLCCFHIELSHFEHELDGFRVNLGIFKSVC